jgi:hypothetical protein
MANDLTLHVKTTADGKGLRQAADDLDKTTKATDKTKKATDKLGDSFHETTKATKNYNEQLKKLYAEREHLARSYQESGDREMLVEFNRANRHIGLIEKLRKAVTKSPDAGQVLRGLDLPSKLGGFGPTAIAAGGGVLAAAAPPLGAMIGGAFSGTVVGAAMAGGILAASRDPAVKSAADEFGEIISKEFFGSGKAFVFPIQQSLGILADAVDDMELGQAFAKVAPQVTRVADGIGRMGKNLMPGLNNALDRSAGFSKEFADGLAEMGSALGKAIDDMSSSEGAVEGLNALFKVVNGTIVAFGMTVNVLADTFDVVTDAVAGVTGALQDIPAPLQVLLFGHAGFSTMNDLMEDINKSSHGAAGGFAVTSEALGGLAEIAEEADAELRALEGTIGRLLEKEFGLEEAQDAVSEATARLKEQLREQREEGVKGAGMLTGNTQAALDNREAVRGLTEKYADLMVELEQSGKSTINAEQEFADLLVSMGFGRVEAQKYAAALRGVKAELDKIKSKEVTLTVRQQTIETYKRSGAGGRNVIEGFASGGETPASTSTDFRPFYTHPGETMWSDRQHFVATKAQTEQLARMGSMGSSSPAEVRLTFQRSGHALLDFVIENLSAEIRKRGGSASVLGIRSL